MNRQYGALSGVAILLIVVNHTVHFGLQLTQVEAGWLRALTVLQALGVFAVPTFLFISGAFLSYASGGLTWTFMRSSLERILWPYAIWSVTYYLVVAFVGAERYSAAGYVKNLLVGFPYHFVPLLVFWYAAAPVVVRLGRRHGGLVLGAVALYQALLLAQVLIGRDFPAWTHMFRPPVLFRTIADWGIYFPLGLVLTMHHARLKPSLVRMRWMAAAVVLGLFGLGILDAFKVVWAPWARFVVPVPAMFLLPVIDRAWVPAAVRFEALGRRSYGVYLCHFVAITLMARLAARSGLAIWAPALLLTLFAVALGAPLLLMEAMARTHATRRIFRYVFGVVPTGDRERRRVLTPTAPVVGS